MVKSMMARLMAAALLLLGVTGVATAQEDDPFKGGDYWNVTAVELMPGKGYEYGKHLAAQWRESMEFAKSKGWIKDYMVVANVHARDGEADMYLIEVFEEWTDPDEEDKRAKEWREWSERTVEEMEEAYGDRSTMRRIMGDTLLRELKFRN